MTTLEHRAIEPIRRVEWITRKANELEEAKRDFEIRTRGRFGRFDVDKGSITIHRLFTQLRKSIDDLPLTVLIHGWGSYSARELIRMLALSDISSKHAVWLILADGEKSRGQITGIMRQGAVVLDPAQEMDARIHRNLVADLVFFPAQKAKEKAVLNELRRRTSVVVVDQRGPFIGKLLESAKKENLPVYLWSGNTTLNEGEELATPVEHKPDLDELGANLKEQADNLEDDLYRKGYFCAYLREIIEIYPDFPTWSGELVRLADKYGWPDWTHQCLPKLYVPLEDSGDRQKALTWHYVLGCVPEDRPYNVLAELCSGKFFEVGLSRKAEEIVKIAAEELENSLSSERHVGEGRYVADTALSLQKLGRRLSSKGPTVAAKVKEVRRQFLIDSGMPHSPSHG